MIAIDETDTMSNVTEREIRTKFAYSPDRVDGPDPTTRCRR